MTKSDEEVFKDDVFDSIIKDYGKLILKQVQLPQNTRIVNDIIKGCLCSLEDKTIAARKIIRTLVKDQ